MAPPGPEGLDLQESSLAAELAAASYLDEPHRPGWTVEPVWRRDTQAFIFESPDLFVIAFRGTEADDIGDWCTDIRCVRRAIVGVPGGIHRGFLIGAELVAGRLRRAIEERAQGQRVLVVGHSLGGALAQVFLAILAAQGVSRLVDGVVTFGAPRVASRRAAAWLHKYVGAKVTRWQAWGDRVPLVPPLLFGFRHFGRLVQLGPAGEILPPGVKWLSMLRAFLTPRGSALGCHSIGRVYVSQVGALPG